MTLTDTFDLNSSHVNIDAMLYWSHSTPRRRPYKINGIRTCLPKQQNDLYTLPHHRSAMMFRAPLRYALSRCCRHYVLAKRNVRALASNSRLNTAKSVPSQQCHCRETSPPVVAASRHCRTMSFRLVPPYL